MSKVLCWLHIETFQSSVWLRKRRSQCCSVAVCMKRKFRDFNDSFASIALSNFHNATQIYSGVPTVRKTLVAEASHWPISRIGSFPTCTCSLNNWKAKKLFFHCMICKQLHKNAYWNRYSYKSFTRRCNGFYLLTVR